ncbi:MAG: DUF938 domain-containing protein [Pseudomonadota bacterium]
MSGHTPEKDFKGASETALALESRDEVDDGRLFSPSVGRNKQVICDTFLRLMPTEGRILEVGSGTGEHAATIASVAPALEWRPSDPDETSRRSISAWAAATPGARILPPLDLRTTDENWGEAERDAPYDGLVSINMIHIAPWAACLGLLDGATRLLAPGGRLFFYGPFMRDGEHTAPSNADFDASLKRRDPAWGVRDLAVVAREAEAHGLRLAAVVEMPANNLSVAFERDGKR